MKIRYVLMSCNSNKNYLGYWPVVARAWRKLNITPVLFYIRDSNIPPPRDRRHRARVGAAGRRGYVSAIHLGKILGRATVS